MPKKQGKYRCVAILHFQEVNTENQYLLAEALECMVFAVERLSHQHSKETIQALKRPLRIARKALDRVKIKARSTRKG